jgi:1,4-dihydroxy-2-naphthoate octaprenyltransferase
MLIYIAATAAVALAAGAAVVLLRGGLALPLMAAGAFFVLFYTWPLKYIGLGEPAVLLVWGPLMTGGAYYSGCGEWSWAVAGLGVVYGLGPTNVLFGKHIDKSPADAAKGIRTLPVLLGDSRARITVISTIALQYLIIGALVAGGMVGWPLLLCLFNLPAAGRAMRVFREPKPDLRPESFPTEVWPLWFAHQAFVLNRRFSGFFLAGLLLQVVLELA